MGVLFDQKWPSLTTRIVKGSLLLFPRQEKTPIESSLFGIRNTGYFPLNFFHEADHVRHLPSHGSRHDAAAPNRNGALATQTEVGSHRAD